MLSVIKSHIGQGGSELKFKDFSSCYACRIPLSYTFWAAVLCHARHDDKSTMGGQINVLSAHLPVGPFPRFCVIS